MTPSAACTARPLHPIQPAIFFLCVCEASNLNFFNKKVDIFLLHSVFPRFTDPLKYGI